MWGIRQSRVARSRRLSDCRAWYGEKSKESYQIKKAPGGAIKKNPRRPEHIKIHKSVAAFALASCPQIVIAQGLGPLNIGKFRRSIKACMLQIGMKKAEKSSKNAKCCDLDNMFTG